jgi:manganese transport protein
MHSADERQQRQPAPTALPGEQRVLEAAQRSLRGERRGLRALWPFLGPGLIASVAYIDPGNFATNVAAGSRYGYMLLWVVLLSNLMAMLIQMMSAKLGIATGLNLAEVCRERFPRRVTIGLWVQAELVAMATDLAEFLGAALALNLLFGVPLVWAGIFTGGIVFGILALQTRGGFRRLEAVIAGMVGLIVVSFVFQVLHAGVSPAGVVHGLFVPRLTDAESVVLGAGILGATVMPHVIYLHSALTQRRVAAVVEEWRERIYRFERIDVLISMATAGVVNMSMLAMAAGLFNARGLVGVVGIDQAYYQMGHLVGGGANLAFGLALLASGLSSSSVGTLAGQVVMEGFLRRNVPLFVRRGVTMMPALVILGIGVDPSRALVLSQVALSFGIPFALVPLVIFCADRPLMGRLVNGRATTLTASVVATVIVALNVFLLVRVLTAI